MEFPEWIIGLILSTMASFAGCLGLVLQKLTHQRIALARQQTLAEMNKSRKSSQEASPTNSGTLSPVPEALSPVSPDASRPNQNAHAALLEFSAEQQRLRGASKSRKRNPRGSTSTISEGDEQNIDDASEEEEEEDEEELAEEDIEQRDGRAESTVGDLPEFKKEATGISIAEENAAGGDEVYTLEDVKAEGYATKPLWLLGMLVVIIGSLLDVVAFGFAPQSLIAPLASLTLVFNTVVAPKLLGEKLSWRDKIATLIICAGTVLVVIFSTHNTPDYDVHALRDLYIRPIVLFYFVACAGFSIFLFMVASRFQYKEEDPKSPQPEGIWRHIYPFSFPGLAGTLGGLSLLFAKSSMELLKFSAATENQFVYPEPYVTITGLAVFLYLQMRFLNSGLARFDALYVIPIYQVFWMISGIIGGGICFREFDDFGVLQAIMFPLGTAIDFFGIYILSARETLKLGEDEKHGEGLTLDGAKNVLAMAVHRQSVLFGPRNSVFGAMGSPLDKVFTPHMLPSNFLPPRRITVAQSARDLSSHRRMSYFDRMPFGGPGTMPSLHFHTSGGVPTAATTENLRARRHSEFPSKHRPRRSRVKQNMNNPREEINMHASVPLSIVSASAEDLPPPNPGPTPNNSESFANLNYAITPSPTMAPNASSPRNRPPAFSTSLSPRTQGHNHSKSAGGASIAM